MAANAHGAISETNLAELLGVLDPAALGIFTTTRGVFRLTKTTIPKTNVSRPQPQ